MCRFDDEEEKLNPTFSLSKYYPNLEATIKELLTGNASIEKLEPLTVASHITDRFVNALSNSSVKLHVKLVFHGTMTANFPNIQKRGFLVPGKSGVPIVNGNAYGSGIYLSTCPKMSLSYVRDHPKLLVCALLEGDRSKVTSHGNIRVAKDPAYVLPCYVLHYKGSTPRQSSGFQRVMSNPYIHNLFFFLIILFKMLALALCLSVICFIGSFMCLQYNYFMEKDPIPACYEVNQFIWDIYAYIFYSIIFYAIYYILFTPLYYICVLALWVINSITSIFSWSIFWIFYWIFVLLASLNTLGIVIIVSLLIALVYFVDKKLKNSNSRTYYNRRKYKLIN